MAISLNNSSLTVRLLMGNGTTNGDINSEREVCPPPLN